ncbi:uncharacterized protein LOC126965115 [Leptidea sinapis]|uniref:uncharacterized protein LOC126965115 n=1 Tax=Leptidea sinapis TaxID=189913 RepID=UPI0021C4C7A5|nr:uncharacterized protein LOC126965115 [Leptidea sinapis]
MSRADHGRATIYLMLYKHILSKHNEASLTKKQKTAARLWHQRWGFYKSLHEIQEEEAQRIGFNLEEYRAAVRSVNCKPPQPKDSVYIESSPKPIPTTSSGMVGYRANCALEKYGRIVKTSRDYPLRPPLAPGQIYDPYKQTMIFLGSVDGDPVSYKLPTATCDVTDDMWARPQQLNVTPFEVLERCFHDA